jgi:phenylacetic acid degradation operon negative regulatory protein
VNARSALFDLYGDHLATRGGEAPVAALVRCLAALGIAAPAVRTAISRLVSQDWLVAVRTPGGPGYALTPRARRRLDEAAGRIYRTRDEAWNGQWQLLVLDHIRERSRRDRVRAGLRYLGFGAIEDSTWIAARPSTELDALLAAERAGAQHFTAAHDGDTHELVRRVWDLDALAASYDAWLTLAGSIMTAVAPGGGDEAAFAARSRLVHEWRKFLFTDPALPPELLPAGWIGRRAAQYFDEAASRLLPATTRFIDRCIEA